jgi:hypothetical protein
MYMAWTTGDNIVNLNGSSGQSVANWLQVSAVGVGFIIAVRQAACEAQSTAAPGETSFALGREFTISAQDRSRSIAERKWALDAL